MTLQEFRRKTVLGKRFTIAKFMFAYLRWKGKKKPFVLVYRGPARTKEALRKAKDIKTRGYELYQDNEHMVLTLMLVEGRDILSGEFKEGSGL